MGKSIRKAVDKVAKVAYKATGAEAIAKANKDVIGFVDKGVALVDGRKRQQEEAKAEKAANADQAQKDEAIRQAEQSKQDQLRVKAANEESSKGSSIILGTKSKKKKKGSSVSSGLGLSSGSTGLQS